LKDKRPLPQKTAVRLVPKLNLTPLQESQFIESLGKRPRAVDLRKLHSQVSHLDMERTLVEDNERNYKILAQWEYYGILTLMDLDDFRSDKCWIAKRLGISPIKVDEVMDDLITAGFIEVKKNEFTKKFESLTTASGVRSRALRQSHLEALQMAQEKIESVPLEKRCIRSSTVAINPGKLPEARELIRELSRKLSSLMGEGKKSEVYQMNFQLFPLTETEGE